MAPLVDLKPVSGFISSIADYLRSKGSAAIDYLGGELAPKVADPIGNGVEKVSSVFGAAVHTGGEIIDTALSGLSGIATWVSARLSSPDHSTGAPPTWDPSDIGVIRADPELSPNLEEMKVLAPSSAPYYDAPFGV
jgi:hypothetical protein